jgi:hypothetical protein
VGELAEVQLMPSTAEMDAIFPAPNAWTGPARSTRTVMLTMRIEVCEKAISGEVGWWGK